ncbi:MAG: hypothetical protein ACI9KR_001468 [Arcticibacterium sp.]
MNSYKLPTKGRGYVHEIKAVQQAIASGLLEHPDWTHQNSLDLVSLLDQVQKLTKRT